MRSPSDSANSATALYTGKKSTVNALNAYTDSSTNAFSDPKFESGSSISYILCPVERC